MFKRTFIPECRECQVSEDTGEHTAEAVTKSCIQDNVAAGADIPPSTWRTGDLVPPTGESGCASRKAVWCHILANTVPGTQSTKKGDVSDRAIARGPHIEAGIALDPCRNAGKVPVTRTRE